MVQELLRHYTRFDGTGVLNAEAGMMTVVLTFLTVFVVAGPSSVTGQQPAAASPAVEAYGEFRSWLFSQSDDFLEQDEAVVMQAYRDHLASRGLVEARIDATLAILEEGRASLEVELWNEVLTAADPGFNTEPNAFLVRMVTDLEPGRALDVGMGQGRNAIWLAQRGWSVTGFDPADRAVALARDLADRAGVDITTVIARSDEFAWGSEQWDLVVLSYVSARPWIETILQALRPGGHVVLEAFHHDATENASIGRGVVYETNELLDLFSTFRILRYEDGMAVADFGGGSTRVVRLFAMKE
jgi:2-polyprenyl-3-methyl-5-hydroxy-6-metoxy-1,4-benzoquinol methylase